MVHLNSCENTHRDTNTDTHSRKTKSDSVYFLVNDRISFFNGQLKLYYTHTRVAVFCIYSSVNGHRDWFCVFAFCKMCCKKHDVQVLFWYANFNSFREYYPWKLVISIVIALFPFPTTTHPLQHLLLFDFILWLIYFILYVCVSSLQIYNYTMCMTGTHRGHHKKVSDLEHGCEPPCECWEQNTGSLQEYRVLRNTEASLQALLLLENQCEQVKTESQCGFYLHFLDC